MLSSAHRTMWLLGQQLPTILRRTIFILCFRLIHYRGAQARSAIRGTSSGQKLPTIIQNYDGALKCDHGCIIDSCLRSARDESRLNMYPM